MATEQLNSKFQRFKEHFDFNNKIYSDISEAELIEKLQNFRNECRKQNYIEGDLFLDEAYPGVKPTSFIINLFPKKQWLDNTSRSKALDQLLDILSNTTEPNIRENIFTLRMLSFEELSSEQIKKLFYDKDNSDRPKLIDFIKTGTLAEQQIRHLFDTNDNKIITLFLQNNKAQEVAYCFSDLKMKWLQWSI
jgi:hypothetical protein